MATGIVLSIAWVGLVVAFIRGVVVRRSRLRAVEALEPDAFAFRFATYGEYGPALESLPRPMLEPASPTIERYQAVTATRSGLTIWRERPYLPVARIPWASILEIEVTTPTYRAGLSSRSYPSVAITVAGPTTNVIVPFLSANAGYWWRATSVGDAQFIVDRLRRLRKEGTSERSAEHNVPR